MKPFALALGAILLSSTICADANAQETSPDPYANETKEQRDARMGWWRDARFGMFIHWGVYAVPAGTYKGKEIQGIGEWIMRKGEIPVKEYRAFAKEFNPTQYDPKAWAALAKKAGMRYIVITSKHHDGFALFPSDVTDWDIADASPYGKDLIGPLAKAARAEGLKFGLYYSQAQDWTHPGGAKGALQEGEGWDELHKGDFNEYLETIAVPQVNEILTRYRPDVLWWDTPRWMNDQRAARLIPLIGLSPGIITNDRLGGSFKGDTDTPEQRIPATGFKDRDWEVCMTMNDTWGYKSYDHNWKSTQDLIRKLCDIASKGGNFLLNVGPTADGVIPQPSVERLEQVGAWMDVNGEAIYGTTASPFYRLPWGRATKKITQDGAILYLHVFDWPADGKLIVPGLKNQPESITLLAGGTALTAKPIVGDVPGLAINVPQKTLHPIVSVLKMEIKGELAIESVMPKQSVDGTVELLPTFADLHNEGYSMELALEKQDAIDTITGWTRSKDYVEWSFEVSKPGTFKIEANVALENKSELTFNLSGQKDKVSAALEPTGGMGDFRVQELGTVEAKNPGVFTLELRPAKDSKKWSPVNVREVTLAPVP